MDVRIGIVQSMKEIEIDLADTASGAEVEQLIDTAVKEESLFWLTDRKGRRVGIPGARVAYIEFGAPASERRVGFGAA